MLNRLLRRDTDRGLATSRLYDQNTFYKAFERDLLRAKQTIVIESPFITQKRLYSLLATLRRMIRSGVCITINTKPLEEQDVYFEGESKAAIVILQDLGVRVLITGGHHRKLAIIDDVVIWEGSLNILSQADSCEIMRRIESKQLARQIMNYTGLDRHVL